MKDLEKQSGIPANALKFKQLLEESTMFFNRFSCSIIVLYIALLKIHWLGFRRAEGEKTARRF